MQTTQEMQPCTRCHTEKPLEAFRRQKQRPNGRDTICRACRSRRDHDAKANSFGPLPQPEGSEEWVAEVWRRAAVIRAERGPAGGGRA
jgi:hypothetical protein